MPHPNPIPQWLREQKLTPPAEDAFRWQLRRALLSSSFYPTTPQARWQRRLRTVRRQGGRVVLQLSSISVGAVVATVLLAANQRSQPETTPATMSATSLPPTQALQAWHERGTMRYVRQEDGGVRVYALHLDNGAAVELRDATPYTITVAD